MKALLTNSTLLLLLMVGATAEPQGEKKKGPDKGLRKREFANQFCARFDKNKDGAIDQSEFATNPRLERATPEQQATLFNRFDKDGDGFIRRNEIKPTQEMGSGKRPRWLQKGPVNFKQFSQQPRIQRLNEDMRQKLFDRLDQNSDGMLSEADIKCGKGGKGKRPQRRAEGPPSRANLDTDQDGKVSFAEFQNAPFRHELSEDEAKNRFDALDKDSDGFLSAEERPKRPKQKEGKPKKQG